MLIFLGNVISKIETEVKQGKILKRGKT